MNGCTKRRVQAQRKFAQGAYVPPTSNAPGPSRLERTEPGPEERNIIQNNVSASDLLDFVSFQGMHAHSYPIVLIERLTSSDKKEVPPQPAKKDEPSTSPVKNSPVNHNHSAEALPPPSKVKVSAKNSTISAKNTMCLRSRSRIVNKSTKKADFAKRRLKHLRLRKSNKQLLKMRRKRVLENNYSNTTSDADDNIPLKFFKKNNEESRKTRSSSGHNGIASPPKGNSNSPAVPKNQHPEDPKKVETKQATKPDKAFKQPAIPLRHRRTRSKEKVPVTKPAVNKTAPTPAVAPADKNHFYGNVGIERWLSDQAVEASERSEIPSVVRELSPCPSESLRTVRDVFEATPETLAKRCNECTNCALVNMVEEISSLVQAPQSNAVDVYDFNEPNTPSTPPPLFVARSNAASPANESVFYLDLQKESNHIIQMTSVRDPNSAKKVMKAKLIQKSEAHTTDDISLVEHENILEQLLRTLKMSNFQGSRTGEVANSSMPQNNSKFTRSKIRRADEPPRPSRQPIDEAELPECRPSTSKARPEIKKTPEVKHGNLKEAPTFRPTEAEFNDPIAYFEKIAPIASKYGLCKVVAPPSFKPGCILNDEIKFKVTNHYIARLYSRWGPIAREMSAIKAYLATQKITFPRVPLLESLEGNLYKLYTVVQRHGGLNQVMDEKLWTKVAEDMRLSKGTEKTLDGYYVKYILPYESASHQERTEIMGMVERAWNKKYHKLEKWASNPLHTQKKLLGESDSSDDDRDESESDNLIDKALNEAEDCVVRGRTMNVSCFKKVAANALAMYAGGNMSTEEIEAEYWRIVLFGMEHVCVNAASIDTSTGWLGFPRHKADAARHPWNLKMLSSNSGNVLRSLGAVLGVTVPTLHLGMVFSTSCWHRDPHGLPWIEYMHEGPPKIWYGIPDEQSSNFRKAVERLCPTSCQNKSIWLSSDITMIPPNLLCENRVSLSRIVQKPGEFIIVFPKAYSCSIATGFTITESVYFATDSWLNYVHLVFEELKSSCEPTMFSLEQLLLALAGDARSGLGVLQRVHSVLATLVADELKYRRQLKQIGIPSTCTMAAKKRTGVAWNVREQAECQVCRCTLYLSKVTGITGKKEDVCPMHAVRLLQSPKYRDTNLATVELVLFYPEKILEEIMNNLKKKISPKLDVVKPVTSPLAN